MWLFFGILAIITAICNLRWYHLQRNPAFFRFASLSCTALTLCGSLQSIKSWVLLGDYGAIEDVVPSMSTALFVLVVLSILMNGITLLGNGEKN